MMRAVDVVRLVAPKARANYLAAFEKGDPLLAEHGIVTSLRLAHFLAQVLHETCALTIRRRVATTAQSGWSRFSVGYVIA